MHFESTYLDLDVACRWLRGNHHGHSTVSDGKVEPLQVLKAYEVAGYDYFALSEHDTLLPPERLQPYTSMCVIPAVEVTSVYNQTLLYLGADRVLPARQLSPRQIMEQVDGAGGLFIFNHPNWQPRLEYATDAHLDSVEGLRGIEIYTGVIERLPGEARATDRWDRLLSRGWRVFGHATDDQHIAYDYFVAWNCVQWLDSETISAPGIVKALAAGRFYASTGVKIDRVGIEDGGQSFVVSSDADEIHWVSKDGVILKKTAGGQGRFEMDDFNRLPFKTAGPAQMVYVRAECLGQGHTSAWTQPCWIVV
ncbi:MAG: hypothetical protein EXR62_18065 [Chloroflexi bacterium]|nr:hypothetical protein [Chloroflexota bacterium]